MIRSIAIGSGFAALVLAGAALAQNVKADAQKGKQIATQVCAACHAADGNSVAPANPKLAAQLPEYLYKQLNQFKSHGGNKPARENPIMASMAATLSDADMKNVAAYFSEQALRPAAVQDKDLAEQGQKLYRGGDAVHGTPACAGCHGPTGAGIPAQYPRIAGQFPEYVALQLNNFKTGTRANDPNGMMRAIASRMSEDQIRAVAQYVAGLR